MMFSSQPFQAVSHENAQSVTTRKQNLNVAPKKPFIDRTINKQNIEPTRSEKSKTKPKEPIFDLKPTFNENQFFYDEYKTLDSNEDIYYDMWAKDGAKFKEHMDDYCNFNIGGKTPPPTFDDSYGDVFEKFDLLKPVHDNFILTPEVEEVADVSFPTISDIDDDFNTSL